MTFVGDAIRAKREGLNLSQEQLAKRVGDVTRAYIAQIESGRTKWPAKYVRQIEKALEMSEGALDIERARDLTTVPDTSLDMLRAMIKSGEIDEDGAADLIAYWGQLKELRQRAGS